MSSAVDICNFALSHLGVSKLIASLTEASKEAEACNLWYAQCRDEVLRDFPWPFATVPGESLALVEEFTDSNAEWRYSYSYPADALKVVRSPYGATRNPTVDTAVKYRVVRASSGGRLLYLDQDAATVEYIVRIDDPEEFSPDFVAALSYLIASRIAPAITSEGSDKKKLTMEALYERAIGKAKMNALSEMSADAEPMSGFESSRA